MASVGDGLCSGFSIDPESLSGCFAQFDWGGESIHTAIDGEERLRRSLDRECRGRVPHNAGPEAFFLTHYHADHYRGLVAAARIPKYSHIAWAPNQVFIPGMPKLKAPDFYKALYCMNAYVLGSNTSSMEFDLLSSISMLGGGNYRHYRYNFSYKRLYQGDNVKIGSDVYEVAWPPRTLSGTKHTKAMQEAVNAYNFAKEADNEFRNFANQMEEGIDNVAHYWEDGERRFNETRDYRVHRDPETADRRLSQAVKDANQKLKAAANALSMVLFNPDRYLVMGDAGPNTYGDIIKYLVTRKSLNYEVIFAPHHGTYWGEALFSLRGKHVLVSNGRRLVSKYRPEWGLISDRVWSTYFNHDIYF